MKTEEFVLILIIDGYNLIKQVFHKVKGKLENQRNQIIKELGYYKKKRENGIKDIILVFDGGFTSHADRQIHDGVVVIFSGNKDSADDWIIKFVEKHKNEEMLLVTKDRKLKSACKNYGVDALGVYDFYDIVQNTILEDVEKEFKIKNKSFENVKKEEDYIYDDQLKGFELGDSEALDILMSQADIFESKKDEEKIKKKSEKMSKKDKRIYKKIKKL
ncbi:hypothetical protein GF385_02755 [Candidatus Dependentiae bacterium]|nr:hypothetical protein [Candidatus Dependentiae bacterium]